MATVVVEAELMEMIENIDHINMQNNKLSEDRGGINIIFDNSKYNSIWFNHFSLWYNNSGNKDQKLYCCCGVQIKENNQLELCCVCIFVKCL